MATIVREFRVPPAPEDVWKRLADVGSINTLIDFLGEVTVEGDVRSCSLGDDGVLEELIVSVDHERRRFVYSIRQSPFGMEHHHASIQAVPDAGGTRLVWITDVKPDAVAPVIEEPIDAAVQSIQRQLSA